MEITPQQLAEQFKSGSNAQMWMSANQLKSPKA